MSGSFESMRWNACVHRLDLGLYSHPIDFWGNRVRTHVNSKVESPPQPRFHTEGGDGHLLGPLPHAGTLYRHGNWLRIHGFLLEKKNVRPKTSNVPLKSECNGFTRS